MKRNRNKIQIKVGTIESFSKKGELKALALFLLIKRSFVNSTVYGYTPEKLTKIINVSNYHARILVNKLIRWGLLYIEGDNLRAVSYKNLRICQQTYKGAESKLTIHRTDSLSVVVTKLRFSLLKKHVIQKQSHIVNFLDSLNKVETSRNGGHGNKMSKDEYHKTTKYIKKNMKKLRKWYGQDWSVTEGREESIICGYRRIGSILGISQGSVKVFLQKIKDWNYIKGFAPCMEEIQNLTSDELDASGGFGSADKIGRIGFLYLDRLNNKVYLHKGTSIYAR